MQYPAAQDQAWEPYVQSVAAALLPHLRRPGIPYRFHVVESPEVNAFAIPGGHVYVFTGMLGFLRSESELAVILGHEVSHVDLRHSIERFQYGLALKKIGLEDVGKAADLARLPLAIGYRKYQEEEADEQGVRLCAQAGYDPAAGSVVFGRMMQYRGAAPYRKADTPAGEVAGMLEKSMVEYFRTHPPDEDRARRLVELARRYGKRGVYVGAANYQQRVARGQREFAGERR
jgi:predicted Zn-dependent protease